VGRISVSQEFDAPVAQVWRVVEPIERHVDWMMDARSIRFESDQHRGTGTRFVCETKVGPITLHDRMEITEWAPEQRMGVRHSGIVTGTGEFQLASIDLDRRTRFTWTEELHFPWYLGGRLGERLGGQWLLARIWRRNLQSLARLVEQS
jgi:uncharacterized protein YndB with AHSA1/START domain